MKSILFVTKIVLLCTVTLLSGHITQKVSSSFKTLADSGGSVEHGTKSRNNKSMSEILAQSGGSVEHPTGGKKSGQAGAAGMIS